MKKLCIIIIIVLINTTLLSAQSEMSSDNEYSLKKNTQINRDSLKKLDLLTKKKQNLIKVAKVEIETPIDGNYLYTCPPYPLPSKGNVNTLIYWDTKLDINNAEMTVYNINCDKICGKERITINKLSEYNGIVTWDGTGYQTGVYLLTIKHGTRLGIVKMVIE